jgi:hypothetical protein
MKIIKSRFFNLIDILDFGNIVMNSPLAEIVADYVGILLEECIYEIPPDCEIIRVFHNENWKHPISRDYNILTNFSFYYSFDFIKEQIEVKLPVPPYHNVGIALDNEIKGIQKYRRIELGQDIIVPNGIRQIIIFPCRTSPPLLTAPYTQNIWCSIDFCKA